MLWHHFIMATEIPVAFFLSRFSSFCNLNTICTCSPGAVIQIRKQQAEELLRVVVRNAVILN